VGVRRAGVGKLLPDHLEAHQCNRDISSDLAPVSSVMLSILAAGATFSAVTTRVAPWAPWLSVTVKLKYRPIVDGFEVNDCIVVSETACPLVLLSRCHRKVACLHIGSVKEPLRVTRSPS